MCNLKIHTNTHKVKKPSERHAMLQSTKKILFPQLMLRHLHTPHHQTLVLSLMP